MNGGAGSTGDLLFRGGDVRVITSIRSLKDIGWPVPV